MKKIIFAGTIIAGFLMACTNTYATDTTTYGAPILKTTLDFHAAYASGQITMSRKNITEKSGETITHYSIVQSATNHFPVYPESAVVATISDGKQTQFVEKNPLNGIHYYRICAVTNAMDRYCSNVVKLIINRATHSSASTSFTAIATPLTDSIKSNIDSIVTDVMSELDAEYLKDLSTELAVVNIFAKKSAAFVYGRNAALFSYLKEKLQQQAYTLRLRDLLNI